MHMDNSRRRALVLTDISTLDASHGEPDDTQSMVRLFLYANELDVEGLITKALEGEQWVRVKP